MITIDSWLGTPASARRSGEAMAARRSDGRAWQAVQAARFRTQDLTDLAHLGSLPLTGPSAGSKVYGIARPLQLVNFLIADSEPAVFVS
jgi:hypothetical protein